jgi:hypothetical protein
MKDLHFGNDNSKAFFARKILMSFQKKKYVLYDLTKRLRKYE